MRLLPTLAALLCLSASSAALGQVQEKKLIDRLLQPDMSLQNDAQQKKFTAFGATTATTTKRARTKTFPIAERPPEKSFLGARTFWTRLFPARRAAGLDKPASLSTRGTIATPQIPATVSASATRPSALPADRTYAVSEFPGTRPFLVRGKSQKALSAQDRPLTLEQVRELLNKNK